MDWSYEKYSGSSPWLGFALVFVWGVVSLAQAYDRSLASMNDSFNQGFMVVGRLSAISDALDHLNTDQEAFLSTDDGRFQDGVIESAESLELNIDILNTLAGKTKVQPPLAVGLSRSIEQVLDNVGKSDNIKDARSSAVAREFFESKEATISLAKLQADQLRWEITRSVSGRIESARGTNTLFEALFYGTPAAIEPVRGAALSNSSFVRRVMR